MGQSKHPNKILYQQREYKNPIKKHGRRTIEDFDAAELARLDRVLMTETPMAVISKRFSLPPAVCRERLHQLGFRTKQIVKSTDQQFRIPLTRQMAGKMAEDVDQEILSGLRDKSCA